MTTMGQSAVVATATVNEPRCYVLDTNVLLHDPSALYRFKEKDICIPLVVLEELDRHKKGVADIARNARAVTRELDTILKSGSMDDGFSLESPSNGQATGRLFFKEATRSSKNGPVSLDSEKADNHILAVTQQLGTERIHAVLVTKDINLRVKAMALAIPVQDYRNDRVFDDSDVLPSGFVEVDEDFWNEASHPEQPGFRRGGKNYARVTRELPVNSFLLDNVKRGTRLWRVESNDGEGSVLYALPSRAAGDEKLLLQPQNDHQRMALNLLLDDSLDFVALLGKAGSGKTLLALAAGLEQVRTEKYQRILITRATVPLGEEIGFLPGTEDDKMAAWLGGTLQDCMDVLKPDERLKESIKVSSMSFMRGRSFHGHFIIVDEAQNLTIKQMRALLTRAAQGAKVVVTGNLAQIDTPYLDEGSSGLAWAAKNMQGWAHAGNVILPRGVRSRLATFVEDMADEEHQSG